MSGTFEGSFVFLTQDVSTIEQRIAKRGQCFSWLGGGEVTHAEGQRCYSTQEDVGRPRPATMPLRLEMVQWVEQNGPPFLLQDGAFVGPFHSDCGDDVTKLFLLAEPDVFKADLLKNDDAIFVKVYCPATRARQSVVMASLPKIEKGEDLHRLVLVKPLQGDWRRWTEDGR